MKKAHILFLQNGFEYLQRHYAGRRSCTAKISKTLSLVFIKVGAREKLSEVGRSANPKTEDNTSKVKT